MSCNICDETSHQLIINDKFNTMFRRKFENCPACQAAPRFRTFKIAYDLYVKTSLSKPKEQLAALVIAGTQLEQNLIAADYGTLFSSSLYGEYGSGTVKSDLRNLKEFHDDQFDLVQACGVLDFICEIDQAFSSVYRVLKADGLFVFHILPFRLQENSHPPTVNYFKKEPYFPKNVQLPSLTVGKRYILKTMIEKQFKARKIEIADVFSNETDTWFIGKK